MTNCSQCGSLLPEDQGSRICSVCMGDQFHGSDGYYLNMLRQQEEEEQRRQYMEELQEEYYGHEEDSRCNI